MPLFKGRWYAGLLLCLAGLFIFCVGSWPVEKKAQGLTLTPDDMRLNLPEIASAVSLEDPSIPLEVVPAILEIRTLVLYTPGFIRPGDPARIRLEFIPDPEGELGSNPGEHANLFDTHHVAGEAHLEFAGLAVDPPGTQSRSLAAEEAANFQWSVVAEEERKFAGTAWFYLRFIPKDGGQDSEWPLAALNIELPSLSIAGLSGRQARWLGGTAVMAGLCLVMDLLLRWLDRWLKPGTVGGAGKP